MNWKPEARTIVQDAGMSARPGFYSGRGAMVCDLGGGHLQKIYDAIKTHYGDEAAKNFVVMVADVPVLSATDFLLALYRLESADWKWEPTMKPKTKGISYENEGEALGTIMSVFGGMPDRDETVSIRSGFLREHKAEVPDEMRDLVEPSPYSYDMYGRRGYRDRW